jgi:NAD(P)-dependent dehydrogenase (short-subunit alcohol dehydrogenase family)
LARYRLKPTIIRPPDCSLTSLQKKLFLVVGDDDEFARILTRGLEAAGASAVLANPPGETAMSPETPGDASVRMERVCDERRPIAGIIVCHTAVRERELAFSDISAECWKELLRQPVVDLLKLVQSVSKEVRKSGGWIVAISAGGSRASSVEKHHLRGAVTHAGNAGFLKALSAEWPEVCCKAIDLRPGADVRSSVEAVLREIAARDEWVEVSYQDGQRAVWMAEADASLPEGAAQSRGFAPDTVVLVTGGARGITAEVVRELASGRRLILHLVGQSPLPAQEAAFSGIEDARALKETLIAQLRQRNPATTPKEVDTAIADVLRDREIRATIAQLRQAGSIVHYHQLDVRDLEAFGELIEEIYRTEGRIDGVIHGAGVIEDRLVEAKTIESFDKVLATKIAPVIPLARLLRPDNLKFVIFFTSVAGLFGNRGQTDYSAANEILNALARHLAQCWPQVLVRAINWGPWRKGMVSAQVQRNFAARGVQLISPETGRRCFVAELARGREAGVEILLGDGPWRKKQSHHRLTVRTLPLVADIPCLINSDGQSFDLLRTLDPAQDVYLLDHRLDGRPVLPTAMHLELMAEVAARACPEREFSGLERFQLLKGVVLEDGLPVRLRVSVRISRRNDGPVRRADVTILDAQNGRHYSRATVLLTNGHGKISPSRRVSPGELRRFPLSVSDAYGRLLFHGPRFHAIDRIHGIGEKGISGSLWPSHPRNFLAATDCDRWLIDPAILDGAFQLAILWIRSQADMTPLPARLGQLWCFASISGGTILCEMQAESRLGGSLLLTNVSFLDHHERLVASLVGMEFNCSRALNRLAGTGAQPFLARTAG